MATNLTTFQATRLLLLGDLLGRQGYMVPEVQTTLDQDGIVSLVFSASEPAYQALARRIEEMRLRVRTFYNEADQRAVLTIPKV